MDKIDYQKMGERLRKIRKCMGLTQEQVADNLNVGRDAILRIEKGNRKIGLQELSNLSKLYHISINELIAEDYPIDNNDIAFIRGFNGLSEKDKKEIISLIEHKNNWKLKITLYRTGDNIWNFWLVIKTRKKSKK